MWREPLVRHLDLWYVHTILCPLSRSIVIAWCDVAVMWTLHVLCVALEARQLWKSSMMPLCWSASPNWTHVFILSYHSQMVSTAPTKLPGLLWNWSWDGLQGMLGGAPEPPCASWASRRSADVLGYDQVCWSAGIFRSRAFTGVEGSGKALHLKAALLWICVTGTWPEASLGVEKPSSAWESVLGQTWVLGWWFCCCKPLEKDLLP